MRHTKLVSVLGLSSLAIISGCANYGQEKHFESKPSVEERHVQVNPNLASVYLLRPKAWAQSLIYIPIPPLFYAVDERLVSVMPLGSYLHLQLPPGHHKFTRISVGGGGLLPLEIYRKDVSIELTAGSTTYISALNSVMWDKPFQQVSQDEGRALLSEAELAKYLYAPITVDTFLARVRGGATSNPSSSATSTQSTRTESVGTGLRNAGASLQNALPSAQQVGNFFEAVATVALIALLIVGVAAGAGTSGGGHVDDLPMDPPVAIYRPAVNATANVRTSSGVLTEVTQKQREATLKNATTGVTYKVSGDTVTGSDGSRYRVAGSTVFSNDGGYYTKAGNTIYSNDGRSCNVIGNTLHCGR